jgi:hypothetical protein
LRVQNSCEHICIMFVFLSYFRKWPVTPKLKRLWMSTMLKKNRVLRCKSVFPTLLGKPWLLNVLPIPPDLAYKPHLARMHIVSLGNLSLGEYICIGCDYALSLSFYCHCVITRPNLNNSFIWEVPQPWVSLQRIARYWLPPNEGTCICVWRIVANFLSAISRTFLAIQVFYLFRYPCIGGCVM